MANDTPFMRFWSAMNEYLCSRHLPELAYGDAFRMWHRAQSDALRAVMQSNRPLL